MSDEQRQDETVEETQPSTMPVENETNTEDDLPEDTSERTREQFEKLKARNAQLAKKVQQLETQDRKSVLDALKPSQQPQTQKLSQEEVDKIYDQAIDEDGSVDPVALKRLLIEANDRAKRAEEAAIQAQQEARNYHQNDQVTKVHSKYPQLDPNNLKEFNPDFYKEVEKELLYRMYNGQKEDFMEAADLVASKINLTKQVDPVVQQRDQIKATAVRGSTPQTVDNELLSNVRRDRPGALEELIRRSGI